MHRLIAEARGRDPATLRRVAGRLSQSFGVSCELDALQQGGVCVYQGPVLEDVRARAALVLQAGADFRVLDTQGRPVVEGQGGGQHRAAAQLPPRPSAQAATMMGVAPSDIAPRAPLPRPSPPALVAPVPVSSAPAPSLHDIDDLDVSALVTLDGTPDARSQPQAGLHHPAAPADAFAPPADDAFAPPSEDAFAPPPASEPRRSGPHAPATRAPAVPARSFAPPDDFAPPPETEGETLDLAPIPEGPAPIIGGAMPLEQPRSRRPEPRESREVIEEVKELTPSVVSVESRPPRQSKPQPQARRRGPWLLLGGRLRQQPRIRILVGFLLALGLGAILPMCHASSVMRDQVEPLRKELSTSMAHATILAHLPSYRSPDAIKQEIGSVKTKHGLYSFLLWAAVSGGIVAAWFKLT